MKNISILACQLAITDIDKSSSDKGAMTY